MKTTVNANRFHKMSQWLCTLLAAVLLLASFAAFAADAPVDDPYYGEVYAASTATTYTAPAETPEEFAKLHPIMELVPGISWGAWNSKKQYTLENIEDAAKILDAVRANAVCCAYATPAQIPTDYDIMIALSDGSINQKVYISTKNDRVSMILNDEYRLEYALTGWASAYIDNIYRPYTEIHIQTVLTPNPDATSMVAGGAYASITDSQELEIWNLVYDNAVFYSDQIELVPEEIDLDLTYCYPEWMMEEVGIDFDTNKVIVIKAKTIGGSDENRPVSYHLTYQLPAEVIDQIKYILDTDLEKICLTDSVKADIKEFAQMYPRALDIRGVSIEDVENFIYNDDISAATEIILALQLNGCEADQYLRNALAATTYEEMKMWLAREIVDVCEDDVIYKDYTSYLINEVKTSYTHSTTVENQAIVAMYTATWIKTLDAEAFYSASKR